MISFTLSVLKVFPETFQSLISSETLPVSIYAFHVPVEVLSGSSLPARTIRSIKVSIETLLFSKETLTGFISNMVWFHTPKGLFVMLKQDLQRVKVAKLIKGLDLVHPKIRPF